MFTKEDFIERFSDKEQRRLILCKNINILLSRRKRNNVINDKYWIVRITNGEYGASESIDYTDRFNINSLVELFNSTKAEPLLRFMIKGLFK